jgi:hypothetical protein
VPFHIDWSLNFGNIVAAAVIIGAVFRFMGRLTRYVAELIDTIHRVDAQLQAFIAEVRAEIRVLHDRLDLLLAQLEKKS